MRRSPEGCCSRQERKAAVLSFWPVGSASHCKTEEIKAKRRWSISPLCSEVSSLESSFPGRGPNVTALSQSRLGKVTQVLPQKGADVVSAQKQIRSITDRPVPAGQFNFPVVEALHVEMADQFFDVIPREDGVIPTQHQQRSLREARILTHVGDRIDNTPALAKLPLGDVPLQSRAVFRHSVPNGVGNGRAAMVEDIHLEAPIERAGQEPVTEPETVPEDSDLLIALFCKPIQARQRIDDALPRGGNCPADIG